ncbi:hypothetical protein Y032_0020g206 [Ancylostoma ceylanicum]|uniref:Uncharacterized protein n=1 Tax=Ancylostoma ceylanicum TaxID=53326 RepID=A0A016V257_9BILA|nr:hypothetical protein Y032_0020g206 [Ancylostoma ceylanicum]
MYTPKTNLQKIVFSSSLYDFTSAVKHLVNRPYSKTTGEREVRNLYNQWIVPGHAPFVKFNLNSSLEQWVPPSRARSDDYLSHCADFIRRYLVKACRPAADIKQYACRIADNNIKVAALKNLPDFVTNLLIGCLLEALQPEDRQSTESNQDRTMRRARRSC